MLVQVLFLTDYMHRLCTVSVYFSLGCLPVEGEDFSADMLEVVFPAGTTDGTVLCDSLSIINDSNLEGTHQFSVHITGVTGTADLMNQVGTNPTYATVEIIDDEGGCCTKV